MQRTVQWLLHVGENHWFRSPVNTMSNLASRPTPTPPPPFNHTRACRRLTQHQGHGGTSCKSHSTHHLGCSQSWPGPLRWKQSVQSRKRRRKIFLFWDKELPYVFFSLFCVCCFVLCSSLHCPAKTRIGRKVHEAKMCKQMLNLTLASVAGTHLAWTMIMGTNDRRKKVHQQAK